ncbi:MAG: plastocyanin/azurin family copper-binding protein [Verrucomicrobiota bacterium JB022]|nr:plastocyanin/azurin family copper-binding protein [Verrucomicrobiota bacterium JB022]
MKDTLRILPFTLILAGAAALSGCGDKPQTSDSAAETPVLHLAQIDKAPEASFTITANDQMKFNLTRIEAKPGQVLSITLDNIGKMPKASMGHNLVVLHDGVDPKAFASAAARASQHEYLPPSEAASILTATRMLGGGESDTIVFQLPDKPGLYPFVCSFPGHFSAGMKGVIVVQ